MGMDKEKLRVALMFATATLTGLFDKASIITGWLGAVLYLQVFVSMCLKDRPSRVSSLAQCAGEAIPMFVVVLAIGFYIGMFVRMAVLWCIHLR